MVNHQHEGKTGKTIFAGGLLLSGPLSDIGKVKFWGQ
jgi:hypothetical protein